MVKSAKCDEGVHEFNVIILTCLHVCLDFNTSRVESVLYFSLNERL